MGQKQIFHILKILTHYVPDNKIDEVISESETVWLYRKNTFKQFLSHVYRLITKIISDDGLKVTAISLFDSYESRFAFNEEADAQDFFNARDIYCIENNITAEAANEEVDD